MADKKLLGTFGDATNNELVSTAGDQSIAGSKTFTNGINLGSTNLTAYKEGTTTLTGYTNESNTTACTATVKYTKIGRMVVGHFTFDMTNTAGTIGFYISKSALSTAGVGMADAYFGAARLQRIGSSTTVGWILTLGTNTNNFYVFTDASVTTNTTLYATIFWQT